jgi:hypothetical protein
VRRAHWRAPLGWPKASAQSLRSPGLTEGLAMARVTRLTDNNVEYAGWRRWMRAIGNARERYYKHVGMDPIASNEPATVGLLLTAAGQAGLLGMLEYPTRKRTADGEWCYGRCDLWVGAPRHNDELGWALEVKRRRIAPGTRRKRLLDTVESSWEDSGVLDPAEGTMRLACTIFYSESTIPRRTECAMTLDRLTRDSDWSWRITHNEGLAPMYILFRRRRRGRARREAGNQ